MNEWIEYVQAAFDSDRDSCEELGLDYNALLKAGIMGNVDSDCVLPDFDF